MRVLVVDDSPELRLLLRLYMEDAGMEVEEATCGAAALARLSAEPPLDAAVLDQRMPDISGLEVAARAKEREPATQLFLFSSYLQLSEQEEAGRLGVEIVPKSDVEGVVRAVRAAGSESRA